MASDDVSCLCGGGLGIAKTMKLVAPIALIMTIFSLPSIRTRTARAAAASKLCRM